MMTLAEKAAYLKGLIEGMSLKEDANETKLFKAIIDMLDDVALDLEDLENEVAELGEQVNEIDEDLGSVEEDFYGDECDCCDDDEDEFFDITCPECGEEFSVDEEILMDGSINCPNCDELLEFDIDEDDCCCCDEDCDCDHE